MKTKQFISICLVALGLLAQACQQRAVESEPVASPATSGTSGTSETPAALMQKALTAGPTIQLARILALDRPQGVQSTEIRFATATLKPRLKPGAMVTMVPLNVTLTAVNTSVTRTTVIQNPCSDALPRLYDTEFAPLTESAWLTLPTPVAGKRFSENVPFDVCVIYPAVAAARSLNRDLLDAALLPKKVPLANIVLALDINGDDTPEILLVEYWCDNPQAPHGACDLTCTAVYRRQADDTWYLIETQTPC